MSGILILDHTQMGHSLFTAQILRKLVCYCFLCVHSEGGENDTVKQTIMRY